MRRDRSDSSPCTRCLSPRSAGEAESRSARRSSNESLIGLATSGSSAIGSACCVSVEAVPIGTECGVGAFVPLSGSCQSRSAHRGPAHRLFASLDECPHVGDSTKRQRFATILQCLRFADFTLACLRACAIDPQSGSSFASCIPVSCDSALPAWPGARSTTDPPPSFCTCTSRIVGRIQHHHGGTAFLGTKSLHLAALGDGDLFVVRPESVPHASILRTRSMPSTT